MKAKILIGFITCLLVSCNLPDHFFAPAPECAGKEMFPEIINPNSEEYQAKVKKELRGKSPDNYRYFFKTFLDEGGNTYMMANFRNEHSCFDAKMLVNKWDKLKGMKRTNGESYPNELFDLKWDLGTIGGKEEIVYQDMHEIID